MIEKLGDFLVDEKNGEYNFRMWKKQHIKEKSERIEILESQIEFQSQNK